jgi:hypothetical protein
MEQLRACDGDYGRLHTELLARRLAWWESHQAGLEWRVRLPRQAYTMLLLQYMRLDPVEVPVVYEDESLIVWRSYNFCPMLEACIRLDLDTRNVCRAASHDSVQALITCLHPRLRFDRSYKKGLRPYAPYCEERIALVPAAPVDRLDR